jgi:hypothetical protein
MPLPYLTAPGNVRKALAAIQTCDVPTVVDSTFINESMSIPGTSGKQVATWLKKIGFIDATGAPTEIYGRFRNPDSAADAALSALHTGYGSLYSREPLLHRLPDEQLVELIRSDIARGIGSNVVNLVRASIRGIAAYAQEQLEPEQGQAATRKFAGQSDIALKRHDQLAIPLASLQAASSPAKNQSAMGGAVYNIYLSLPATSDEAVFAAIFSALKNTLIG